MLRINICGGNRILCQAPNLRKAHACLKWNFLYIYNPKINSGMNYSRLSVRTRFIYFLFSSVAVILFIATGCKKEETPEENPQDIVKASAIINGAFTTFTRSFYTVTPTGSDLINTITFTRSDNTRIRLTFKGTEPGEQIISNTDTLIGAKYIDASNRQYIADSGKIVISDFFIRDGLFQVSGGFEFNSYLQQIVGDTTIILKANLRSGGFVDISNQNN
jgi:hypothetical protein